MNKRESFFVSILQLSAGIILSLCFCACSLVNRDLKGFLEYYTGTAGVAKVDYPETCGTTSNGIPCIDSKTDKEFTIYLRNPQQYGEGDISISYDFNDSSINKDYIIPSIKLNPDGLSATITFSQVDLSSMDNGAIRNATDNSIIKDLSAKIRVYSNVTKSYFDGDYELKVMATLLLNAFVGLSSRFQKRRQKNQIILLLLTHIRQKVLFTRTTPTTFILEKITGLLQMTLKT